MLRKLYRPGKPISWNIVEKETIDEVIFRTLKLRNRLILELMARGGMRIGEVWKSRLHREKRREILAGGPAACFLTEARGKCE